MSDELMELPESWAWSELSELAVLVNGDRGKNYPSKNGFVESGVPFINAGHLDNGVVQVSEMNYITEEHFNLLGSGKVKPNDILYCLRGSLGKTAIVKSISRGAIASSLVIIRSCQYSDPEYLYNFLVSPLGKAEIHKFDNGSAQPNLSCKSVGEYSVPLPPLNEQKRIVAAIAALRDRTQKAREALEAIPALCDKFRQSVLAAAFRGDLTADWREQNPDIEPASVLLEKIRSEEIKKHEEAYKKAKQTGYKFPRKSAILSLGSNLFKKALEDLPTWCHIRLGALFPVDGIFDGPFGSNLKTVDYTSAGVRVIRLENIGFLDFIEEKESYISNQKYLTLKKHTVCKGDLIFSSFASDGVRTCVLPELRATAIAKADCFCLRPYPEIIDKEFLAFQLSNPSFYKELQALMHGATRLRVNTTQLKETMVFLCPLSEQREIVNHIKAAFKFVDSIEHQYQEIIIELDQLDLSVLAKAFRGELIEQDPNDEPASILLERIRAEREKLAGEKKGKGKRATSKGRKASSKGNSTQQMTLLPEAE